MSFNKKKPEPLQGNQSPRTPAHLGPRVASGTAHLWAVGFRGLGSGSGVRDQ